VVGRLGRGPRHRAPQSKLPILTLATILGEPDIGLITVGVWTLCCIGIQCVRIAQAGADRLRGRVISPFLG